MDENTKIVALALIGVISNAISAWIGYLVNKTITKSKNDSEMVSQQGNKK